MKNLVFETFPNYQTGIMARTQHETEYIKCVRNFLKAWNYIDLVIIETCFMQTGCRITIAKMSLCAIKPFLMVQGDNSMNYMDFFSILHCNW